MNFIINFNLINQKIDLTESLIERKEWWFNSCTPKIPVETEIENLTNEQKISLIKLAIYEGYLDIEHLCNLPNTSFKIN